jgi:hypothetical protein
MVLSLPKGQFSSLIRKFAYPAEQIKNEEEKMSYCAPITINSSIRNYKVQISGNL